MTKLLSLVCAICILSSLFLTGCSESGKTKVKENQKAHQEMDEGMKQWQEHSSTKQYLLLSLKYGEEFKKVKAIIVDYKAGIKQMESQIGYNIVENKLRNKDVNIYGENLSLMKQLSIEHKISEAKLASIIIDYNILNNCEICANRE